ncbi:MAG: hypothetical protein H8E81_02590 [Deltaproteobacteria bacterium]|nr:hypothetical protein [Deltaproteobacteria bacterium]
MANKPIVIGLIGIAVALLLLGNQALALLMEKDTWAISFYLSDFMDTQWLEGISYAGFLATTPLYMLIGGLGILLVIIGAFIQK